MQFIPDGPDIPERLLQLHEDGEVVFFCGAGISMSAGLPNFECLVRRLREHFHPQSNLVGVAVKERRLDTAIGLIESEVRPRGLFRRRVTKILTADEPIPADGLTNHRSLLQLSKWRDRDVRLVTTNFDRLFEAALGQLAFCPRRFEAPALPVPSRRWASLVYLHGLIPAGDEQREGALESLVLSSGDFGRLGTA